MRNIYIDSNSTGYKYDKMATKCIGVGRCSELMRHIPYMQLKEIQKDIKFKYIRFHGLFQEEMNIVNKDEDGNITYNFLYLDLLIDEILSLKLKPILELGLMPNVLAEKEKYVFWWKMNISMPKDINDWINLIKETVLHLQERYGEKELKKWYFEIWNEPNHKNFFSEYEHIESYFALYDSAAKTIKSINKKYRVGGPASAGMVWVREMIDHCKKTKVPLDFISSHSYGTKIAFDGDGKGFAYLVSNEKVSTEMRVYGQLCKENKLPFIVTEWSSSASSVDFIHDNYLMAPYVLHTTKLSDGYADMMSYWVYTDIFEENGAPNKPFYGGFGLMTVNSIKKPIYYAYEYYSKLYDTILPCDDIDVYASKKDGKLRLLIWNVKKIEEIVDNKKYYKEERIANKLEDASVTISNLKANTYYDICVKTVGYKKGDPYTEYVHMGFPTTLSHKQEKILKEIKPEEKVLSIKSTDDGKLNIIISQMENQLDYIDIKEKA